MFARVPAAWPNLRATEFSRGSCCVDFLAIEPPITPPLCANYLSQRTNPGTRPGPPATPEGLNGDLQPELPLAKLVAAGA